MVSASHSFSEMISSVAKSTNQTWPFVTVPDFELHAGNVREMARADVVALTPYVDYSLRLEWNKYSRSHLEWWRESRERSGRVVPENYQESMLPIYSPTGQFRPQDEADHAHILYWQCSPTAALPIINFDLGILPGHNGVRLAMKKSRGQLFGDLTNFTTLIADDNTKTYTNEEHDALHASFTSSVPDEGREKRGWAGDIPHVSFYYPVFEVAGNSSSRIVAHLYYFLALDAYITNLLPDGTPDLLVVFRNTNFEKAATFIVRGNNALIQSWNNSHDPMYDSLKRTIDLTSMAGIHETYDEGSAQYFLDVYPTDSLAAKFDDDTPIVFAVLVGVTFGLMLAAFFSYGFFVDRRNRKVTITAAKSSAIVSSLFPPSVRDRLYKEQQLETEQMQTRDALSAFRRDTAPTENGSINSGKPIADLFPESTIIFADLAGFTAWSSGREPTDVFMLLETIYNAFDV